MKKILTASAALLSATLATSVLAQESMVMAPQGADAALGGFYRFGITSAADRQHDLSDDAKTALRHRGYSTQDLRHWGDSELSIDFSRTSDTGLEYGIHTEYNLVHEGASTPNSGGDERNDIEEAYGFISGRHGTLVFGNTDHVINDFQTFIGAEGSYGQNDHFYHPLLFVDDNNRIPVGLGTQVFEADGVTPVTETVTHTRADFTNPIRTLPNGVQILNGTLDTVTSMVNVFTDPPTIPAVDYRVLRGDGFTRDVQATPFAGVDQGGQDNAYGSKFAFYSPNFNGFEFGYSWEDGGDGEGDSSIGASYETDILGQADIVFRYGHLDRAEHTSQCIGNCDAGSDGPDGLRIVENPSVRTGTPPDLATGGPGNNFGTGNRSFHEFTEIDFTSSVDSSAEDYTYSTELTIDNFVLTAGHSQSNSISRISTSGLRGFVPFGETAPEISEPGGSTSGGRGINALYPDPTIFAQTGLIIPEVINQRSKLRVNGVGIGYQFTDRLFVSYYGAKSEDEFPTTYRYAGGDIQTPVQGTGSAGAAPSQDYDTRTIPAFQVNEVNFSEGEYDSLSASYLITDGVLLSVSYNRFDIELTRTRSIPGEFCFASTPDNPAHPLGFDFCQGAQDIVAQEGLPGANNLGTESFSNDGEEITATLHIAF